ncbi:hypothetical protein AAEO57_00150 [Flavobacterium sp. DGU38]|uniref:Uncharacterized protein n=1 Tax=Flavobacterium calami TaxID=3139144 RepID=A0ABU9IIA2_9FLAO
MKINKRLTKYVALAKVNSERQVVNFSIALNKSYRLRNETEPIKILNYIYCF